MTSVTLNRPFYFNVGYGNKQAKLDLIAYYLDLSDGSKGLLYPMPRRVDSVLIDNDLSTEMKANALLSCHSMASPWLRLFQFFEDHNTIIGLGQKKERKLLCYYCC
jgi:hypothetical protein